LWVADFTYVPTWSGMVYVAFVIDAFSRRILGRRAATSMRTALVLDALEMAIWGRGRQGVTDLAGLVHHNDAGSQYTSIAFTERLATCGVDASVGSVADADAYDNALAESTIGLFKTELIKPADPGGPATRSRSPPSNTSTGTTTAASTAAPRTYHQPISKPCTSTAATKPGAVHAVTSHECQRPVSSAGQVNRSCDSCVLGSKLWKEVAYASVEGTGAGGSVVNARGSRHRNRICHE